MSPAATDTVRVFTAVPCYLSQWEQLKDDADIIVPPACGRNRTGESLFNHQVTRLTAALQKKGLDDLMQSHGH